MFETERRNHYRTGVYPDVCARFAVDTQGREDKLDKVKNRFKFERFDAFFYFVGERPDRSVRNGETESAPAGSVRPRRGGSLFISAPDSSLRADSDPRGKNCEQAAPQPSEIPPRDFGASAPNREPRVRNRSASSRKLNHYGLLSDGSGRCPGRYRHAPNPWHLPSIREPREGLANPAPRVTQVRKPAFCRMGRDSRTRE